MAHYDIYRDQLSITHPAFGHALWNPAPEGEYGPVKVGDVGYVREGRFFRLFNALLPADDPTHKEIRLPEYHDPLIPNVPDHIFTGTLKPNQYCSAGVTVAPTMSGLLATGPDDFVQASFSCRRRFGGAVLSLPVDYKCQDTRARGDFGKWMVKHIDRWFAFARGLGLGIDQMEQIILVTGCDCTRSWANVTFLESQTSSQALFGVRTVEGHDVSINWQFAPGNTQGAVCNWGPEGKVSESTGNNYFWISETTFERLSLRRNLREDQCVFVRGFRVVRIFGIFPRQLKGAAGPNPSPDGSRDDEPDRELVSIPASSEYRDPLHVLLDYIIGRHPDCSMVLVHDDDLARVAGVYDSEEAIEPDTLMARLRKSQPETQQFRSEYLSTNENSSRWDRTEITLVAMLTKELCEWVAPRPSLAAVGYTDQPGELINQSQEGKEVIPHRTVPSELVSMNNRPRDITSKGTPTTRHLTPPLSNLALLPPAPIGHVPWNLIGLNPPIAFSSTAFTNSVIAAPRRRTEAISKRKRKALGSDDDADDDDDDDDFMVPGVDSNMSPPRPNRLSGACTYCTRLKVKCYFLPGENVCKRCRSGKRDCIVEGRKIRGVGPNKVERLLAQLRQKDELIDSLLKQLRHPYLTTTPSIDAYRNATGPVDQRRQDVIAWLDRMQSSALSGSAENTPRFDMPEGIGSSQLEESDKEQESQKRENPLPSHESQVWKHEPASSNTLVEPDIGTYPVSAAPIGLLASFAYKPSRDAKLDKHKQNSTPDDDDIGVASKTYFLPGPALDLGLRISLFGETSPPEILLHGLVTPDKVENLFDIFFTQINPFISLLDFKLHAPAQTFSRSPQIFDVVCAVALRYSDKPEVHPIAMHFARSSVVNALISGYKTVDLCQAYILMSGYDEPAPRFEEDRSWSYAGLAIRTATDLNLHRLSPKKQTTEQQELEMLNRTRTWINCFKLDKSTASQFGKPSTLKEDNIVRNSLEWYKSSKHNHPYDVHLIAYTGLFRIVDQFREVFPDSNIPHGLNRWIDWRAITFDYDRMLSNYGQEWAQRFERDSDYADAACEFRVKLLPFYTGYARLVILSLAFEKTFRRGSEAYDKFFFTKSLESAMAVVTIFVDSLVPTGYMRFAPDNCFVMVAFASAFMLKLLSPERPRFAQKLEIEIYEVIERLIYTIGSPAIAIDERHTPKLYSRFLASILAKHKRDGVAYRRVHQQQPPPLDSSSVLEAADEFMDAVPENPDAQDHDYLGASPDFMSGVQSQGMDFRFDTTSSAYHEDLVAAIQAVQNPSSSWQKIFTPASRWPKEEGDDMPSVKLE